MSSESATRSESGTTLTDSVVWPPPKVTKVAAPELIHKPRTIKAPRGGEDFE